VKIDVEQARKLAKERVKSGQAATLADAQREIARELRFPSWPEFIRALSRLPEGAKCRFCDQPISGRDWIRLGRGVPNSYAHGQCVLALTNRPPLNVLGLAVSDSEAERLTPHARRLWLGAATVAQEFGDSFVGTEHLLLAMVREPDGIAGKILDELAGRPELDARLTERLRSESYNRGLDKAVGEEPDE
jgi:hypothetical protein